MSSSQVKQDLLKRIDSIRAEIEAHFPSDKLIAEKARPDDGYKFVALLYDEPSQYNQKEYIHIISEDGITRLTQKATMSRVDPHKFGETIEKYKAKGIVVRANSIEELLSGLKAVMTAKAL